MMLVVQVPLAELQNLKDCSDLEMKDGDYARRCAEQWLKGPKNFVHNVAGLSYDDIWNSNHIMSVNAEAGLDMSVLMKLTRAIELTQQEMHK